MLATLRTAGKFALFGPLVGLALVVCILLANLVRLRLSEPSLLLPPGDLTLTLLRYAPILLAGAYLIGAPAAFAVGAMTQLMFDYTCKVGRIVAANALAGGLVSMKTLAILDEFILPHPHSDATHLLGERMWYLAGGVGAVSAIICTLCYPSRTGGASISGS